MNDEELKNELSELSYLDKEKKEQVNCLYEEFLMNQPKDIQRAVRKTVEIWGLSKEDPYFLILIQCRITQVLYELTPNRIEQSFRVGNAEIIKTLEVYKKELVQVQHEYLAKHCEAELNYSIANLNSAIAKILEDNNLNFNKSRFSPRVAGSLIASGATLISLLIGIGIGIALDKQNSLTLSWKEKLEAQDKVLLDWAKSEEGQVAKQIIDWNEDVIDKSCEQKVKDLGITFEIGSSKATSGFCVLFVEPVANRIFK